MVGCDSVLTLFETNPLILQNAEQEIDDELSIVLWPSNRVPSRASAAHAWINIVLTGLSLYIKLTPCRTSVVQNKRTKGPLRIEVPCETEILAAQVHEGKNLSERL